MKINNTTLFHPDLRKPKYDKDTFGNDLTHSVDVFIIDTDGCFGLAFFSFEDMKWIFHTDQVSGSDWLWFYPPFEFEKQTEEKIIEYILNISTT